MAGPELTGSAETYTRIPSLPPKRHGVTGFSETNFVQLVAETVEIVSPPPTSGGMTLGARRLTDKRAMSIRGSYNYFCFCARPCDRKKPNVTRG